MMVIVPWDFLVIAHFAAAAATRPVKKSSACCTALQEAAT